MLSLSLSSTLWLCLWSLSVSLSLRLRWFSIQGSARFPAVAKTLKRECFTTSRVKKNTEHSNYGYFIGLWLFGEPSETFSFPFH